MVQISSQIVRSLIDEAFRAREGPLVTNLCLRFRCPREPAGGINVLLGNNLGATRDFDDLMIDNDKVGMSFKASCADEQESSDYLERPFMLMLASLTSLSPSTTVIRPRAISRIEKSSTSMM